MSKTTGDLILDALLIVVVVFSALQDMRTRRISNWVTVSALVACICLRGLLGPSAIVLGLMGAALSLVLLSPLFYMGGVGGGDAKLLIAVGAFLGPKGLIVALLATAIAGGVMALTYSIRQGVILPALLNTRGLLTWVVTGGRWGERTTLQMEGAVSVPYGVAIAAGTIFALWYGAGA
jgi:prepilin peptidase CpaA